MKKVISILITVVMLIGILPIANLDLKASATQDRSYNFYNDYEYNADPGKYMVNIALAQLGRSQSSMGYTEYWCANFVSDCARLAGQTDAIPANSYVPTLWSNIINAGGHEVYDRRAGDIIFYDCPRCDTDGDGHSLEHVGIVIDDTYSVEGNYSNSVKKVTSFTDRAGHTTGSGVIKRRYLRPNYQGSVPPSNVWISLPNGPESSYLPNTEVDITFGADNATSYYLEMYRKYNGETSFYYSETFTSGICYASFTQLGHYSCFVVAQNSSGSITSKWIGWDIVNAPPTNVWVALPNGPESSYLPNTEIDITFGADYADTFHMIMCREYKGVVDWNYYQHSFSKKPDGNDVCHATFDKPGHYSCYINATNMAGGTSSEWIGWDIVETKPSDLSITTDAEYYPVNGTVSFTLNASYGYYKHIGIHKINGTETKLYYEQDVAGEKCSVLIPEPGSYRANFDAFNAIGTTRSDWVYFTVMENKPGKPTVKIKPGTSVTSTYISWEKTTDTKSYDIYIKTTDNELIKYETNYTNLDYSISLPVGNYKINVCSCGYVYDWWTSAGYQTITVKSGINNAFFNPNNGNNSITSKKVTYQSPYGEMLTPTRTGYECYAVKGEMSIT